MTTTSRHHATKASEKTANVGPAKTAEKEETKAGNASPVEKAEKEAKTEAEKKTETRAEQVQKAIAPGFDWDSIPESESDEEYKRTPLRANVEETTPKPIKDRLLDNLELNTKIKAIQDEENKKTGKDKKPGYEYRVQAFPTESMAAEFVKLSQKYARGHVDGEGKPARFTFRGGVMSTDKKKVRYAAKPFEARER